mmetsp:Transcript_19205/g.31427  ORF Transcript_19205/g.31427 Transcript_19205/m.31427 type:complete len:416 (+) Transcript_19205:100-1347(+)
MTPILRSFGSCFWETYGNTQARSLFISSFLPIRRESKVHRFERSTNLIYCRVSRFASSRSSNRRDTEDPDARARRLKVKRERVFAERKENRVRRRQERQGSQGAEDDEEITVTEEKAEKFGGAIQWYPGHIARAERQLTEQLNLVDVVLEVLDARVPLSTRHPRIDQFVQGGKGRSKVLVLNRVDMIPPRAKQRWTEYFTALGEQPFWTDGKTGDGVMAVQRAAQAFGDALNIKRKEKGMMPRAVRAAVIGYPNVGKSALINRLVKRRAVESARRAGVTRLLKWVTMSETLHLLDAPGILPMRMSDQEAAFKLAICDDIGEASYEHEIVAAEFVELCIRILKGDRSLLHFQTANPLLDRYNLNPCDFQSGIEFIDGLAKLRHLGDVNRTARELLNDFRIGLIGPMSLELPPVQPS